MLCEFHMKILMDLNPKSFKFHWLYSQGWRTYLLSRATMSVTAE